MKRLVLALLLSLFATCAWSQRVQTPQNAAIVCAYNLSPPTLTSGWFGYAQCDNTGKLSVNASVSASITGFPTIQSTGTPIAVTTGGVTGTLPTGAVVVASNVGATNGAYCKLGASASTSDQLIPPNSWFAFTVGANTQLTCITSTSTTTVNMVGGTGLPTGSGGGGGGSGSGSVTQGTVPWLEAPASQSSTGTGWTTATTLNSTQTLMAVGQGASALLVQLNQTSTLTGGATMLEGTYDNTNWVTIPVAQVLNPNTLAPLTNPYTLVASTNQPFLILTQGYQAVRIRLSTVITGTATVTPFVTLLPYDPTSSAQLNPTAISQATPGTTNNVTVSPLPRAARNFPGCTVGASSAQCLAANTAQSFLQVENTSASASIACAFGTAAVLNSATSFQIAAGQGASWGPNTSGVPTAALNCIASGASTPLYLEWN